MDKKQKFYLVSGIIVALVAIYFIFFFKNQKGGLPKDPTKSDAPPVTNPDTTTGSTDAEKVGIDTSKPATPVEGIHLGIDTKVFAGQDLNTYTNCHPSTTNIYKSFKKGDYIGNFLREDEDCIVVGVDEFYNYWLPFTGWNSVRTGTSEAYILFNKSVYYK